VSRYSLTIYRPYVKFYTFSLTLAYRHINKKVAKKLRIIFWGRFCGKTTSGAVLPRKIPQKRVGRGFTAETSPKLFSFVIAVEIWHGQPML
jgi:hypothetical protein